MNNKANNGLLNEGKTEQELLAKWKEFQSYVNKLAGFTKTNEVINNFGKNIDNTFAAKYDPSNTVALKMHREDMRKLTIEMTKVISMVSKFAKEVWPKVKDLPAIKDVDGKKDADGAKIAMLKNVIIKKLSEAPGGKLASILSFFKNIGSGKDYPLPEDMPQAFADDIIAILQGTSGQTAASSTAGKTESFIKNLPLLRESNNRILLTETVADLEKIIANIVAPIEKIAAETQKVASAEAASLGGGGGKEGTQGSTASTGKASSNATGGDAESSKSPTATGGTKSTATGGRSNIDPINFATGLQKLISDNGGSVNAAQARAALNAALKKQKESILLDFYEEYQNREEQENIKQLLVNTKSKRNLAFDYAAMIDMLVKK